MQSRTVLTAVVCACCVACGSSKLTGLGPGNADIGGRVFSASGQVVPQTPVVVTCASGAITASSASDAGGIYGADLGAPATIMDSTAGHVPCEVQAGDSVGDHADTTVTVQFYTGNIPHPQQLVDIYLHP